MDIEEKYTLAIEFIKTIAALNFPDSMLEDTANRNFPHKSNAEFDSFAEGRAQRSAINAVNARKVLRYVGELK